MNTKIKFILYIMILCVIMIFVVSYKSKGYKNKIIESAETTEPIITVKPVGTNELNSTVEPTVPITSEPTEIIKPTETPKPTKAATEKPRIEETPTPSPENIPTKDENISFVNRDVPRNNTIKSYMDYRTITLKSSKQYKLQKSLAYTGDNGLRMVNGRYCVALGSYYTTTIGQYVDIELENGKVIKGILADCKSNRHTDSTNRIHPDGSVVEFVVDTKSLDRTAKRMGDISYVNGWNSKVVNIKVYDKVENF